MSHLSHPIYHRFWIMLGGKEECRRYLGQQHQPNSEFPISLKHSSNGIKKWQLTGYKQRVLSFSMYNRNSFLSDSNLYLQPHPVVFHLLQSHTTSFCSLNLLQLLCLHLSWNGILSTLNSILVTLHLKVPIYLEPQPSTPISKEASLPPQPGLVTSILCTHTIVLMIPLYFTLQCSYLSDF